MAYYSLDPYALDAYITAVEAWGDEAGTERTQVRDRDLNTEDEPVVARVHALMTEGGTAAPYAPGAAPGPSQLSSGGGVADPARTVAGCVASLQEAAADLRTRKDEAVRRNEDGITTTTPEGRYTYYLPDGAQDTAEAVLGYSSLSAARAGRHANELQEASENGTTSDRRTLEEVPALADAANRGLLPEGVFAEDVISDRFKPEEGTYPWYSTDEDGRPRVSLSDPPTQEEINQVLRWSGQARKSGGGGGEIMGSVANGFEEARRAGAERAAGISIIGGEDD